MWALILLSEVSYKGLYGQPKDHDDSFRFAMGADATGRPAGRAELAMHYVLGVGVRHDPEHGARTLHKIATAANDEHAMYLLSVCLTSVPGLRALVIMSALLCLACTYCTLTCSLSTHSNT